MRTRLLVVVLYGHFTAAAVALGMPAFYGRLLTELGAPDPALAGLFFVIPTLAAALANPAWGRIADRVGKRPALVRAHLGLAASFFAASQAATPGQFALALALQGLFGGSFAASNAYLATAWSGAGLARVLTLMQGSARAALCLGPLLAGWGLGLAEPRRLYLGFALLPLIAAWLVWRLPAPPVPEAHTGENDPRKAGMAPLGPAALETLNYAFVFATVLGFPLFVPFAEARLPGLSPALAGLLYGLPHGVYLLAAAPLSAWLAGREGAGALALALGLTALSLAGQTQARDLPELMAWRLSLGLATSACYVLLMGLVARITVAGEAGRRFGRFEACTKWGAVSAGLAAAVLGRWAAPEHCFFLGAAILSAAALVLAVHASQLAVRPWCMSNTPLSPGPSPARGEGSEEGVLPNPTTAE